MSTRIIVKNLPKDIKQEKLVDHIKNTANISEVTDCNLKYTHDGVFRKFAFVGFNSPEEATAAQAKLHGTFIKTTKIQVDIAKDLGDGSVKAWSKYSVINIQKKNKESGQKEAEDGKQKAEQSGGGTAKSQEVKSTTPKSGFVVKMRGLTGFYTEKTVKEFFKPLKTSDVRIPKNAQKKPIGVAFVEFSKEKDLDQAMGRNKNFINGKKVFLKKSNEVLEPAKPDAPMPWELKAKEGVQHEVENIVDSGRLFVRNLWFGVTEEELEEVFGKFGPLAEVTLPVDPLTKKIKGFAHVIFVFPEHALKAFTSLDYTSLHGRLLHILPGRDLSMEEESNEKSSYKKKKDQQNKANSSNSYNWNTLFLGANAVADAMAQRYNTDKSNILDDESKGSVGVRMALGETQIVSETREFLISSGVALDSFSQAAGQRSKTVILVKNLPAGVSSEELKGVFGKHGTVLRVIMPPSGITAIVEYMDSSEAKKGFAKLNFSKFRSIPLYLEWAPMGIFTKSMDLDKKVLESEKEGQTEENNDKEKEEDMDAGEDAVADDEKKEKESKAAEEAQKMDEDQVPEEETTLFVKNLNFDTNDEALKEHFSPYGTLHTASVAKKKDSKRPGELLSMGYGFVQFMKKKDTKEALKNLQNSVLDGHNLELKLSNRTTREMQGRKKQHEGKQTSTKILVRNIPFEAKKNEIEELFKVFGDLKFVRLPKKMKGTGPHRGFAFVDFQTKQDAKRAFDALCHSTHLFGRRLVLEWAEAEESIEDLRRKTAQHFSDDGPKKKVKKKSIMQELE